MRCHRDSGRGASSLGGSTDEFGTNRDARLSMTASRREIHRRPAFITADTTLSGALFDTPVPLIGCGDRRGAEIAGPIEPSGQTVCG